MIHLLSLQILHGLHGEENVMERCTLFIDLISSFVWFF